MFYDLFCVYCVSRESSGVVQSGLVPWVARLGWIPRTNLAILAAAIEVINASKFAGNMLFMV